MTKRIIAFFLCVALILGICPTNIYATENSVGTGSYTVTADKTTVNRGDTINFTITLQQKGLLGGYQTFVAIPDGLTLVTGTFKAPENLKTILKMDNLSTDETPEMQTNAYGSQLSDSYSGEEPIVIATFQCTVNNDAQFGDVELTLTKSIINNEMGDEKTVTVEPVTITIEQVQVPVTGISLSKTKLELTEGQNETITATVLPEDATDKKVEWSSDKTDVATVDSTGKITAVKKGTAIITAKTANGKIATCEVTVNCGHLKTTTHPALESTCKVQGNEEYKTCDNCGKVIEGSDAKLPLADHDYGTEIAEEPATHTEEGTKAHYKCSVCSKIFIKAGVSMKEVTVEDLKIEIIPHSYGKNEYEDETYHKKTCGCGVYVREKHKGGKATCKNKAICEVCNHTYGTVNASNHINTETKNQKEATCTEKGYTGDTYCNDCKTTIITGKDSTKLGHTGGEATCSKKAVCTRCYIEYGELDTNNHKNTEIIDAKDADAKNEGYTGDVYCNDCKKTIKKGSVIPKFVYEILSGANSSHEEKAETSLTFKINGEYDKFKGIKIDDNEVDKANYIVKSGSTIVTLKADYLNSLTIGEHKIAFVYEDSEIETNFKITEKVVENTDTAEEKIVNNNEKTNPTTPDTGDNSNIMLWICGLIVSGICFVTLINWNTRKQGKRVKSH